MAKSKSIKLGLLAALLLNQPGFVLADDAGGSSATAPGTAIEFNSGSNAPASTATEENKSAQSAVPDSLRDLVPDHQPAGNAVPPGAGAAKKALDEMPAKLAPKPAAAAHPIVLKGRLEELGGNGARLPVGVVLNLQSQTAKLDPSVERTIQGRVASFPVDWQGQWGGPLKFWSTQFDKIAYEFDPEETREIQAIEYPGAEGTVTFNFVQDGRNISLEPAQVVFPPRTDGPQSRQMLAELQNSPIGRMLGGNGGALLQSLTVAIPVMYLGNMNGRGVTGNTLDSQVVKNDIRQLKPGVLEQNIVTQESERHRNTGKIRRTFSETVLRFTKLNQNQLYVQAASVKYRWDGHFESKIMMYGTVTRGGGGNMYSAFPGAGGFPGLLPGNGGFPGVTPGSGAFPSLSPSGGSGAGMPDLNSLIKQLQGF